MIQTAKRESLLEIREIDKATGEVVASSTRTKWFQSFRPGQGYLFRPQASYIRRFAGTPLPASIIPLDVARLDYLVTTCLESKTNRLVYTSRHQHKPLTISHIAARLHTSYQTAYRFIKHMQEHRIIARSTTKTAEGTERTAYYVNPLYYIRGKYIDYNLYCLFQPELDEVNAIPMWARRRYTEEHPTREDEDRRQAEQTGDRQPDEIEAG